jgi:Zn-dependent protease with chaperone function
VSLYIAAATLALVATVLLGPVSTAMARARWVDRAPRAGVAVWQAIGASALLAGIGSGLCVAVERYHSGVVGGMGQLAGGIVDGRPLAMIGLSDALGLTLAADLAFVLCCMLGAVTFNTVLTRRRHRRLVDLLALRTLETGAAVLDYSAAVAYCVPGIRPRIVVSAGAIELLDEAELDAVVAHEKGHAHEHHGLVMLPLAGVSKVFAFVPYARLAPTSVAGLLEMAADDYAVRRRDPSALVSALVSMATAGVVPSCTFGLTGGWVSRRVERLLAEHRESTGVAFGASAAVLVLLALPLAVLLAA